VPEVLRAILTDRSLIAIGGEDRYDFLNNILTQLVSPDMPFLMAAALLTPQGKLLDEFLLVRRQDDILIDCHASRREAIRTRLQMYKLRSRVTLEDVDSSPLVCWGNLPDAQGLDPRHAELGQRRYEFSTPQTNADVTDWHQHRISLGVAEGPAEMAPGEQFPLEMGLHLTHAIDFKKGCFIGQEVTSRSYRRGSLRKAVFPCHIAAALTLPATIKVGGRHVGDILCQKDVSGLAHLRLDALDQPLDADGVKITIQKGLFPQ
jgi:folate-binding protein YgfZ